MLQAAGYVTYFGTNMCDWGVMEEIYPFNTKVKLVIEARIQLASAQTSSRTKACVSSDPALQFASP